MRTSYGGRYSVDHRRHVLKSIPHLRLKQRDVEPRPGSSVLPGDPGKGFIEEGLSSTILKDDKAFARGVWGGCFWAEKKAHVMKEPSSFEGKVDLGCGQIAKKGW